MVHFPFIKYMFKQFCELCYDINWIRKRGGCSGLKILFSKLLIEQTIAKKFSTWFIQNFVIIFKAMMFMFADFNGHVFILNFKCYKSNYNCMYIF